MKKVVVLSGLSIALFTAGLIFFTSSATSNVSANEAEQRTPERASACASFSQNGTCGCSADGNTCTCGQNGGTACMGNLTNNQQAERTSCGCQNRAR